MCPAPNDQLLRLIIESAADYAIFSMDSGGLVTSWNSGATKLLGYQDDDILGRASDIIFTEEQRRTGVPQQERQTASETGRAEDERWHVRQDGSEFWASGIMERLADGSGFLKILRDRTETYHAQKALRDSEERFRLLATNIPQLVFRTKGTGERTWGSPQWEVFTGLSDSESRDFGWLDAIHPDDRDVTLEAWRRAQLDGLYEVEHRIRRASDVSYRWHQTQARPIGDPGGGDTDWVGASTDIHELRTLKDRQNVLLAELQHRTKNLLTIILALARATFRTAANPETFLPSFESRIRALTRVQGLLALNENRPVPLADLIQSELLAHAWAQARVDVDGPSLDVSPKAAQALSLAVHELATNAVKYGALGDRGGRLSIRWHVGTGETGDELLTLVWQERDVPVRPPMEYKAGFGTELITKALPYQLHARTELRFEADGVVCTIALATENAR